MTTVLLSANDGYADKWGSQFVVPKRFATASYPSEELITTNGDGLVLSFERNGRRGTIDVVMTLTLDGDMIKATQEFAGGQFSVSGTGKKQ